MMAFVEAGGPLVALHLLATNIVQLAFSFATPVE
jgi:hypothetical protein